MVSKSTCYILGVSLLFSLSAAITSAQDEVITSMMVGECSLSIESNNDWHTLRLRAHHPNYRRCNIAKDSMLAALDAAFSKNNPPKPGGHYTSLSIGRLIDYPWLSQYLAVTAYHDKGWNVKKGKPAARPINQYVSKLLSLKELLAPLEQILAKNGYKITGVRVEKVLVGSFQDVPLYQGDMLSGRVPYDAQVWFGLVKD